MRTAKQRIGLAALAGAACVAGASCTPPAKPDPNLSASDSWCPEGFEVGPQDTCFAVPEMTTKDTPIIVYLHGMYSGHGSAAEWSLVRSVVSKGFAVVVPRGKRGLCAWKEELKDHFCWPQETEDPQAFKSVVADWTGCSGRSTRSWRAAPTSATCSATRTAASSPSTSRPTTCSRRRPTRIVNGGPLGATSKPAKAVPMLLMSADADPDQGPKMKELHEGLAKVGWLHAFCTRPGPHPLEAHDIDASVRFFKRDAEGSLKANATGYYACEGANSAVPEGAAPADKPEKAEKPPRSKK